MAYITSLNSATRSASRNLNLFTQQQGKSISRLSSGTRVASPSDDPSALAIGSRIKSDKMALRQAQSNTRLASSMLQVASGGLESVLDTLTELRALTVRVTNGSLSSSETSLVQEEFEILRKQVDDIAAQTRFSDTSLLSGKGKVADAANKGTYAIGLNDGDGAFETSFISSESRGFLKADFPAQVDIDVQEDQNNPSALVAQVKIAGHTFSLNTHTLKNGDAAVFKSDDGYTQFALEVKDAEKIDTRSELTANLQDVFGSASIAIGATIQSLKDDGSNALTPAAAGIAGFNLDHTSGAINGKVANVSSTGTSGDITVSIDVGSETFRAQGVVIAKGGRVDLVSTTNSGRVLSFNMGANIANNADLGTSIQNFVGGADATVNIGDTASGNGFAATAASFTDTDGLNLSQSRGFFDGAVKDVSVTAGDTGNNVSITLDSGQTFTARNFKAVAAGGEILFYDEKDATNVIALDYTNATDIDSSSKLKAALTTHLGLDNGALGVQFQSANAYQGGKNGFDPSVNGAIKSAGSSYPGKWAFSYDAQQQEFSLKNGEGTYRVKARDADSQVVTFGNGIVVALGTGPNDRFDSNKSIDQVVFSTEDSSDSSFRFRVNTGVDDEVNINIGPATIKDLGLESINVANMDSAQEAAARIDAAITLMNVSLTSVGAQQSRIDAIDYGLQRQYDATAAAEGIILDVDIGDELSQVSRLDVLSQTAAAMFSRAQSAPQRLTDLLLR